MIEEAQEILRGTRDGQRLHPDHMRLVETVIQGRQLSESGRVILARIHREVAAGTHRPEWFHGLEHLTQDACRNVYWRGREVEQYHFVNKEDERRAAIILRAQCLRLEREGKWSATEPGKNDLSKLTQEWMFLRRSEGLDGLVAIAGITHPEVKGGVRPHYPWRVVIASPDEAGAARIRVQEDLNKLGSPIGTQVWWIRTVENLVEARSQMKGFVGWVRGAFRSDQTTEAAQQSVDGIVAALSEHGFTEDRLPREIEVLKLRYGDDVSALID
jgi:hypothetical protein